jgi:hypothetical protein
LALAEIIMTAASRTRIVNPATLAASRATRILDISNEPDPPTFFMQFIAARSLRNMMNFSVALFHFPYASKMSGKNNPLCVNVIGVYFRLFARAACSNKRSGAVAKCDGAVDNTVWTSNVRVPSRGADWMTCRSGFILPRDVWVGLRTTPTRPASWSNIVTAFTICSWRLKIPLFLNALQQNA